ncbi:MAG: efflux transporter outer membrane subunit [Rikenellaceae bacterium]
MKRVKLTTYVVAAIAIIGIFGTLGCSPKLTKSDDTPPSEWLFGEGFNTSDSLRLPLAWWELFADTTLNRLVTTALANNREIEATAAKLLAAKSDIKVVRAEYLPSISFEAEAEGSYLSSTKIVQEYTIEPTLSWEISLFGALKNNTRYARAEFAASQWALKAMRLSIAAEVATTYFTLLEAKCNLEIAQHSYVLREQEAILTDSMALYGMSSNIELQQARSLMFTAKADISQYQRALDQTMLTLATLLGENPRIEIIENKALSTSDAMEIFGDIPPQYSVGIGLPSSLVERRPDIRQSYYAIASAAAKVGIARAERYPTITLSAGGGVFGYSVKALTAANPWIWSATGELIQPIFNFGALKSREKGAIALYMESLYNYEQTMLTAFSEVEKALIAIESYTRQREASFALVVANGQIAQAVGSLYTNGMNDYLNVIDAERELYSAQMELIGVISNQYISYITLFKALGGGY